MIYKLIIAIPAKTKSVGTDENFRFRQSLVLAGIIMWYFCSWDREFFHFKIDFRIRQVLFSQISLYIEFFKSILIFLLHFTSRLVSHFRKVKNIALKAEPSRPPSRCTEDLLGSANNSLRTTALNYWDKISWNYTCTVSVLSNFSWNL